MRWGAHFPLFLVCACASAPVAKPPAPTLKAPYDAPAAAPHSIQISIDTRAAREILAFLSRPRFEPSDAKILQDLPAIGLAITDSGRSAEVFEHDLAAAFEESTRTAVFDFRTIRQGRERWQVLLEAIASRERDLVRLASERAAALLPSDRTVTVKLQGYVSFGVAGLADHLVIKASGGREVMILDLARALGDSEGEPLESRLSRLARLIAGEAYRKAWGVYRESSPNWKESRAELGPLEVFLRAVAEAGPVAIFTVDENFFPLSVWLKEPMKRSIQDLNRRAERLVESQENLEQRVELMAEIRRGDFGRRLAGPAGAFLADAIVQTSGLEALRASLERGPKAFFEAYDRATQSNRDLVPLSRAIRERLGKN